MSKGCITFSKDNEYYTPAEFVMRFGKFDYDPATTKAKADEFGIINYDTAETDGLKADWTKFKRIWINPPFTNKHEFLQKAVETYAKSGAEIFVLLPVEFLTTKRFHAAMAGWGGGCLFAKWKNQIRKRSWQEIKIAGVRQFCLADMRAAINYY